MKGQTCERNKGNSGWIIEKISIGESISPYERVNRAPIPIINDIACTCAVVRICGGGRRSFRIWGVTGSFVPPRFHHVVLGPINRTPAFWYILLVDRHWQIAARQQFCINTTNNLLRIARFLNKQNYEKESFSGILTLNNLYSEIHL